VAVAAAQRAATEPARKNPTPRIVAEASERPDLVHLLCRLSEPGNDGSQVEVFNLREVAGEWRLCICNGLHLVFSF